MTTLTILLAIIIVSGSAVAVLFRRMVTRKHQ